MFDAHVHLDFMANGEEVATEAQAAGVRLFAGTVTPNGFVTARKRFAEFENVDVGLGLHPWWVKSAGDADQFLELLGETQFVNEVGLDFGKRHRATREAQIFVFRQIVEACACAGGKVLSIHSVHAAQEALDMLENAGALGSCTCIFHWFTGPSDQLKRAIKTGCLFSVGPRMVVTGKGREYVKAIPAGQLLIETDAPPEQGQRYSFTELRGELESVTKAIASIKGTDIDQTVSFLENNDGQFFQGPLKPSQ